MAQNSVTLNQIAFNVLNSFRGGRSSHSEHLSLEQIKFNIKYYRSLFIRRDLERNNNRFRVFEQDLGHLDLEIIDSAEDDSISSGVMVMKTKKQIPAPIRGKRFEGITHISSKDKVGEPIPVIDAHRSPWQCYNKFTSDNIYATFRNGYIYIFNDVSIENINVRGIFEDPKEVFEFTSDNSLDLYDENEPYPISADMVQRITQALLNGEIQLLIQTPNDEELDRQQDSNPKQ